MSEADPIAVLTGLLERMAERMEFRMNELQVKGEMTQAMMEGIQIELFEQTTRRNQNNMSSGDLSDIPAGQTLEQEVRVATGMESGQSGSGQINPVQTGSGQADPGRPIGMPNLIPVPGAETSQNPVTRGIPAIRQGTLLDTGENHGTLYGHEHPNGPYAQGSAPGRNTFLVAHQNNASGAAGTSGRAPVAVGTVIHTQERVPASQQVVNLTFPALRIAMGHQLKHRAMFDQYKNLSFFVSDPCLKLLVANEHRLNRNLDMTESSILYQPDTAFTNIFCSYVRVMDMGTKKGFTSTILKAVPPLRPLGDTGPSKREMVLADYDHHFHAAVAKHADYLEKALSYAYLGATLEETKFWPAENYGKGIEYGQIQVLCTTLGIYRENFQNRIGLENLKNMRKREDWFKEIRRCNDELANLAAKHRANAAEIAPTEKLDDIVREVESKRNAPRVLLTKDGPRDVRLPNTPYPRPSGGQQRYPPRDFRPPLPSSGRAAELESVSEMWNVDETFNCDNPLFEEGMMELRRQGIEPDPDVEEDEWRWRIFDQEQTAALNAMNQQGKPHVAGSPKALYDPKAKEESMKPCYRHFQKRDCPGNCGFTHGQEAMQKLMRERLNSILDSPYTPLEYVEQEIARRRQRNGGAMVASLSRAFGTEPAEVDPSDFINELSQLTGMQSPGSRNDGHYPVAPSSANHSPAPVFPRSSSSATRETS